MVEAAKVTSCLMRVFDLERSVNFYRDVFEWHVALHEPNAALLLTPGGFRIYIRAHEAYGPRGIDDVGVEEIIWSAGSEAELNRINSVCVRTIPVRIGTPTTGSLSSMASTQISIAY